MTPRTMRWLVVAALALPASASAQYLTMDRQGGGLMFLGQFDLALTDPGTFLRADFYGQGKIAGWGVYADVPVSKGFADTSDAWGLGNIEVGGYKDLGLGPVGLTVRLGLSLPTASSSVDGQITNAMAGYTRFTDAVGLTANSFVLRLSASPRFDLGLVYARVDAGVDVRFATADDAGPTRSFLRINAAVGASLGLLSATAELANTAHLSGDAPDSFSDKFRHILGFQVGAALPVVHPYLGFAFPLDSDVRGDVWEVTLGVRVSL